MNTDLVNIDFKQMAIAFRIHVRKKALLVQGSIVYIDSGQLIEENPKDSSKQVKEKLLSLVR